MARYYRRRYTRTLVKPKKKWATNLVAINPTSVALGNNVFMYYEVCQNANPVSIPTPVILKTGNFKVQCDAFFNPSTNTAVEFSAYLMYLPEGLDTVVGDFASAKSFIEKHPEWIICWKYGSFDYISGSSNIDTIRMSSRLKRNLNSGDKIVFIGLATAGSSQATFNVHGARGMVQYWTCAN